MVLRRLIGILDAGRTVFAEVKSSDQEIPLTGINRLVLLLPTCLALYQLRAIDPLLLLGFMATVWISDSAAYFTGRAWGKHKLAPAISPGKTWEGVAGALVAVFIYALTWSYRGGKAMACYWFRCCWCSP